MNEQNEGSRAVDNMCAGLSPVAQATPRLIGARRDLADLATDTLTIEVTRVVVDGKVIE